ncbi:pentatricopeptide repeat (PPR) superfamily protein [Carex rostrata]
MLPLKKIRTMSSVISYLVNNTTKRIGSYYTYNRARSELSLGSFKDPGTSSVKRAPIFRSSLSTLAEPLLVQACDLAQLTLELDSALNNKRLEDAWKSYEKHLHMNGLPCKSVFTKLITGLTESFDSQWLKKAYSVVDLALEQNKLELLEREPLLYLSFILARCNLPVLSLNIMRKLIELELYPPVAAWSGIVGHMCQTEIGSLLAAELVMEIGYLFRDNRSEPRRKINKPLLSMRPNSFVFNIALTGCLVFGTTRKAEQMLDLMPWIGLRPEPDLLVTMARVYEKNGHRDEVRKLKRHVEEAVGITDLDLQEFYDCLFSCYLKFGDLESCMDMVLSMLHKAKETKKSLESGKLAYEVFRDGMSKLCLPYQKVENDVIWIKTMPPSFLSFCKDANLLIPETEAKELLRILSNRLQAQVELVKSEHGLLYPTEKLYAKLIRAFLEAGRTADLASFLINASKLESPVSEETSAVVEVINACISLGLLDQAHDLLDEMRYSGIRVHSSVYYNLITAYSRDNRQECIKALLKEAQQAGVQLDLSCYEAMMQFQAAGNNSNTTRCNFKETKDSNISEKPNQVQNIELNGIINPPDEASLAAKLMEEIKHNPGTDYELHDWNSMIHFFCKKQLMHDAQKALNKMRFAGHTPNAQTFHSLVTAYLVMGGKYTEVTELWGEMKVLAGSNLLRSDRELLDLFLHCFVRGGYFLRAMEVIEMMEKGDMFIDKYKYRSLWLKYHSTLYKGKARKVQTDAQLRRREAALAFMRWIGLT